MDAQDIGMRRRWATSRTPSTCRAPAACGNCPQPQDHFGEACLTWNPNSLYSSTYLFLEWFFSFLGSCIEAGRHLTLDDVWQDDENRRKEAEGESIPVVWEHRRA